MANSTTIQMVLKLLGDFSDVNGNISQLQQKLDKIKMPAKFKGNFDSMFSDLAKETTKYQKLLNSGFKTKGDVTGLEASGERISTLLQRIKAEMNKIEPGMLEKAFEIDPSRLREVQQEVTKVQEKMKALMSDKGMSVTTTGVEKIAEAMHKISKNQNINIFKNAFKDGDINKAQQALDQLKSKVDDFTNAGNKADYKVFLSGLETALNELKSNNGLVQLNDQLKEAKANLNNIRDTEVKKMLASFKSAGGDVNTLVKAFAQLQGSADGAASSQHQFNSELDQLKSKVAYFFGISNAVNLLKRTIRESINTVKELDAVMTETAVVTDFTVGDMWEKLPQYAKQASKLGASIKDLYSATTLYYQQGLNSDQAMSVGVETMKMARVANMEASDATTAMTAALRGFNMEINEISATRVNDVYSELAAITAADTSQIATAMGKTASIAASANMEFETTAALLAQIIETTQEAPETAGTAMKTIIARFTEVKELFSEGMLTGEDEEGEEININKIDAALKTVGISLKDFLNGTKGIDDIFLELASKWDTLDLATQRYIATAAAGSRQQSRFIAMMSNYDRTMELVTAANNSAGASQNQYEKTLESMEAKLQNLSNAWDTFVMNLANSDALKLGVDLLTGLLNAVNGLTQALSGGNGLSKSMVSFMSLFAAFKGGKSILQKGGQKLFGVDVFNESEGLIRQALSRMTGKDLTQTGEKAIQSVFTGFERGLKTNSFGAIFTEQFFAEEAFRKNAKAISDGLSKMLDDDNLDDTVRKKYYERKVLLDKAAEGDKEAGVEAGMKLEDYEYTKTGLTGVATAAMGAGAAFNLLGGAMDSLGWETAADLSSSFGTSLLGLGSAASMAAPLLQSLGVTANQLAIAIPVLAVAFTLLPYAFKAIKAATPEGKLEAAQEATLAAGEAAESAANSYESLKNALEGLDASYNDLNKMVYGTQQWKESAHALNEEVTALIDQYPELADYFEYKNGVMSKKKGADQEIDRLLRQDEIDTYRAKQVQTQAKIREQSTARNVLSDYNLDYAFQYINGQGNVMGDQAENFAQEFAKAIVKENLTEEVLRGRLEEVGLSLTTTFEALRSYGELLLADETRYDSQIANNIKTQAQISGYTSEEIQALDSNIIADIREAAYGSEYEKITLTLEDKDEFANLMGYRRQGDNYYNKETGQQIQNITDDAIKVALASSRADDATIAKVVSLTQSMSEDSITSRLLSDEGTNLTSADIQQLNKDFSKQNIESVFGIDIEKLAKQAGAETEAEVEAFFNNIKQNIESAQDRIKDQRVDLVASMNKYTKVVKNENNQTLSDLNANILRDLEDRYGEGFRDTLDSVFMALQRSGDDAIIGAGYGNFITKAMEEGTTPVELEKLSEFITDVNWSSPIEAAYQLNQELKHGSGLAQEFARNMTTIEKGYLGAGSQMQYLIKSGDFEGIQEELNGILETSDEISATDVLDLADSYSSLNKMLKNTKTSAAGVAKALEAVTKGDIKVDQLTDAVLASLEGFDSLNSMIAELEKELEDFDPGIDENFASEFIAQASEAVNENLEKGAVGNAQIDKYLDYLFTENWDENLNPEARLTKMEELGDILEKNSENMSDLWGRLAQDAAWQTGLNETGLEVSKDANGEITFTGYEGMSTQEQVNALVEASKVAAENGSGFEISETMAKLMITDFKNYSRDYEYLMGTNERDIQEISDGLVEEGITHIDQSEIDTIELLNGVTGLGSKLEELGVKITSFYEKDGSLKQTKELVAEMAEVQGYDKVEEYRQEKFGYTDKKREYVPSSSGHVTLENAKLDMSKIEQQLAELGLPQEAKNQIAQDAVDSFFKLEENKGETFELSFEASDGSLQTLGLKAGDSIEQAIANRELEIKNAALADSIVKAFGDTPIPVKIEPNTEPVEGLDTEVTANLVPEMSLIDGALANLTATVTLFPSIFGHARGIKNSPTTHDALVGEEGAELIERQDGTAYLSGMNGPEVTTIHAGDTVHTAEETKRIFGRNKGVSIPRFAHGYGDGTDDDSGANKEEEEEEEWENPFDKLYNLVRKIDEELEQRERIERRYEKLLESIDASASKIIEISREELAQLEEERALQQQLIEARRSQIYDYLEENADLNQYANVTQDENGNEVLRINWDLINAVTDPEKGEDIEEYVSQLEEWFDDIEGAEESLEDIEDEVEEIKERGEEQYFELEDTIKEALTQSYQDEIDKLSEINDSINDANTELIEAINSSIDKQRQDRDNERTEEELAEKQRRLLYLQQDTSGANAMEILKLQEEIESGQEDYTDTLIDQKISELQDQNDEAAAQREQQITLLQSQLDHYIESGEIWNEVYDLMEGGLDPDKGLVRGSQLEELLKDSAGFEGLSQLDQMEWLNDTNNLIAQALAYLEVGRQLEDIGVEAGTEIEFTTADGKTLKGTVDDKGNVTTKDGQVYNNVYQGYDGKYYARENIKEVEEPEVEEPKSEEPTKPKSNNTKDNIIGIAEAISWYGGEATGWGNGQIRWDKIDAKIGAGVGQKVQERINKICYGEIGFGKAKKSLSEYYYAKFKTGGLADFTGPAWLDGTKAHPELVLNARDTENFIQLKNILGSLLNHSSTAPTENNGDITYDIDINVESIGSDYDVDQIANKIKNLINDDARYRNNNAVSLMR